MAIPVVYNLRSVKERWTSAVVAVLGIAGTVGVFIAMLSLAFGFKATLVSSGSNDNAMVRRAGSTSEMDSSISLDQIKIMEDFPGVAHASSGPLVTPEVVVIAPFPLRSTGTDANVQVRGVSPRALDVRTKIKMIEGRFYQPGLAELVVGRNVDKTYAGLSMGDSVKFGGGTWRVVGVFDAGGSAFDSEVWCDSHVLNQIYHRPENIFQSLTVHLDSPASLQQFRDAATADPRLTVDVSPEIEYYAKQSRTLTTLIVVLGGIVAFVMGIGAVFGALNTMYSAVAERSREIATLRALGFGAGSVVISFMIEALLISLMGGLLGAVAVLPLNGLTTGAMNWQTFSHLAFAFRITPFLLGLGLVFALLMGVLGGFFPALRAARRPVAPALRAM
ncbi:MAG TPA: ABC transporter permease [Candidatus Angelobacter sp.]|jgi:putative ABC transport system permease protein|nr:ABC transporter permease [Candidatus Angelobacter sp.]